MTPHPTPSNAQARPHSRPQPRSTAVVGLQWGDEGKGKVVDRLAREHDAIVRYNGGANAGHSVVVKGERYALHLVPSGILNPGKAAVIGNGVVVDPEKLLQELAGLRARGVDTSGLIVSDRAHVVLPYHKLEDELREEALKAHQAAAMLASESEAGGRGASVGGEIGTTKRGIGPAYADKVQRSTSIRMGDLLDERALRAKLHAACVFKNAALASMAQTLGRPYSPFDPRALAEGLLAWGRELGPGIKDTTYWLHEVLARGGRLLFEGANATLLDVDHGTYPFVTSSNCAALGIGTGTGVSERHLSRVIGVVKAYSSRVGKGPMPTELHDPVGEGIRQRGREFGTTTGRPRRVGWLDLVAVRYSAMVNAADELAIMLLDVLEGLDELRVCVAYDTPKGRVDRFMPDGPALEHARPVYHVLKGWGQAGDKVPSIAGIRDRHSLPDGAKGYLEFIERYVGVPIGLVSVGPDREQTIGG
jgi:adenylosuccinate synthase